MTKFTTCLRVSPHQCSLPLFLACSASWRCLVAAAASAAALSFWNSAATACKQRSEISIIQLALSVDHTVDRQGGSLLTYFSWMFSGTTTTTGIILIKSHNLGKWKASSSYSCVAWSHAGAHKRAEDCRVMGRSEKNTHKIMIKKKKDFILRNVSHLFWRTGLLPRVNWAEWLWCLVPGLSHASCKKG